MMRILEVAHGIRRDYFTVESKREVYHVVLGGEDYSACTCLGWCFRFRPCKHIRFVKSRLEEIYIIEEAQRRDKRYRMKKAEENG